MANKRIINQEVDVNSFYFTAGKHIRSFPRSIIFNNHQHAFSDGLLLLVYKGKVVIRLFEMTGEDQAIYRLRHQGNSWMLEGIKAA
jgi:hypothetical protein